MKRISLVARDVGHTSVAGDMLVSREEQGSYPEARWHRGSISVLDKYLSGTDFFITSLKEEIMDSSRRWQVREA